MKRLLSLKKLLVMLTFLLCGFCQTENAQAEPTPVRVSDLGVEKFVDKCNYYLSLAGRSERISLKLTKYDNLYDRWTGSINNGDLKYKSGVFIAFSVNKEGYVSKLYISSHRPSSSAPIDLVSSVLVACLLTIGLTKDEYDNFANQISNHKKLEEIAGYTLCRSNATVWGANINRYVFFDTREEEDGQLVIWIEGYK